MNRHILILILLFLSLLFYYFIQKPQIIKTSQPSTLGVTSFPTTEGTGLGTCHVRQVDPNDPQAFIPDPSCTPGSLNTAVTQSSIDQTICSKGYTATIRPPVTYTNNLKRQQILDYGYQDTNLKDYEEDHFISLELGGNPTDPKNLWPEPHPSFNEKDKVENYLNKQVCDGLITLEEAQRQITDNWYQIYLQIR